MAIRSSKHNGRTTSFTLYLNDGLNYAQAASNIGDNELSRAMNFMYDSQTDKLITRPGTDCVTATALASPILAIYYYEKDSANKYLVAASGGKLYYLNATAWVEIGSLADSTTTPSFLTFHNKLLIADGGADIKTWNGTTFTTIGSSPQATALAEIKGRVVANATDEIDTVYFSAIEDETTWSGGTSEAVACGYGDMLSVNAFAVAPGGNDLIVSKKGDSDKVIYRINVEDATTGNWYAVPFSPSNATLNAQSLISAFNDVFFVDSNGFKSVKGVTEYGDMQTDLLGGKINNVFSGSCDGLFYIPAYTAIFFINSARVFLLQQRKDLEGNVKNIFTDMFFNWGRCRSICQAGSTVYLAGDNGYLYKFDNTLATDETAPATASAYNSICKTKAFSVAGNLMLKRLSWKLSPKKAGAANLYVSTSETEDILLKSITLTEEGDYIDDATGYIDDATDYIYDTGSAPWFEQSRNTARSTGISFSLKTNSGRVIIENVMAEFAVLEG